MRFSQFLRSAVLTSAAAATLLAVVTVAGVAGRDDPSLVAPVAAGWWVACGLIGLWLGRRAQTSPPIASLLARARTGRTLPEVEPARTLLNRLWPLLVSSLGAAAIGVALPQVSAIAAGFAIVWALAWRRQASAVTAIEDRDGARFYIERTSPLRAIQLVRTPGFRSNAVEFDGARASSPSGPRTS